MECLFPSHCWCDRLLINHRTNLSVWYSSYCLGLPTILMMLSHSFKTNKYISHQLVIVPSIPLETVNIYLNIVLATCSEDKRLGFLDGNGKIAHIIKKAHPSPINRCKFLNDQVIISGDDDGMIKVWDLRTVVPVFQA